ncbi:MAG: stage II sporulation protein R [Oscillospiraceae bacterium]|nr:stage II sporulation protein R [Oscillospiraceae bacterium]
MYRNLHSPAQHREQRRRLLRRAALVIVCVFMASLFSFQARCAGIRKEVLRLHVIANSDGEADQAAKLAVRDALLLEGAGLFDGSVTAGEAEKALAPRLDALVACARRVLRERGLDYPVRIEAGTEYFNTRTYEGITLPAGRYQALRVVLGDGKGLNWWCVMFPPLCLPAAAPRKRVSMDAVLTNGQLRLVESNPKYEIRFRIVELWEGLMERFR